jgi:serine/threonine protein phosphatase 1
MTARTIAIGDIHGCAVALAALLERLQPTPHDTIILLGDYVDRGPDSRAVLERLIVLSRQCTLVPILGNHEEMLLASRCSADALQRWLRSGGVATLDSYGHGTHPRELPADHIAFIESCRPYYETDRHIFLHANYEPDDPLAQQSPTLLRWWSLRESMPARRHISGKTVILGHTPQENGDVLDRNFLVCIDTYCYGGGWLTAMDVEGKIFWQANDVGQFRESAET